MVCTRYGLNVTKLHCYNVTWTKKCQIRAENRPKLKGKIWKRNEFFVPLQRE